MVSKRLVSIALVGLMVFSTLAGLSSASLSPEVHANMRAYYDHEAPEMVDGPTSGDTGSRSGSRDIVKYFDISVSFGWDADPDDFQEWETEIRNANKKLYDGTDGQMAFRRVDMYNDRERWDQVDIHLNNQNGRAYTYRGGIQWSNFYIELFLNDAGMGGKVIQHEWGHYGLYLPDEYTDSHGPFCKCTMGTTYNTNEWCCESDHCDYDPSYCSSHGEADSCWEQMVNHYPGMTIKNPPVAGPYDAPTPDFHWHLPDLQVSNEDLTVLPTGPKTGDQVEIKLTVRNEERLVSESVEVAFYDGAPGSTLIGTKSMHVSSFFETFTYDWTATAGDHTISAAVDSSDRIDEINENNNTASISLHVNEPPEISASLTEMSGREDSPLSADLSAYEDDAEDGHDSPDLTWTVTDHDGDVITDIEGEDSQDDVLSFTPKPDWNGDTTVELTLTDSVGLTASKDVVLTFEGINDAPLVNSLDISESSVLRMDTVEITMTAEDIEDDLSDLKAIVEYIPVEGDVWTQLEPILSGEVFSAMLTTDVYMPAGYYDIRARVTDTDDLTSEWQYLNSSLNIKNNRPTVNEVSFKDNPEGIFRTGTLTLLIGVSDLETPGSYLTPSVEYSICDQEDWMGVEDDGEFIDDLWEVDFTPSEDAETGSYCFRVSVSDEDGGVSDQYISENIIILNNLPTVTSIEVDGRDVLRTEHVKVSVEGSDVEDDDTDLEIEINYRLGSGDWEAAYMDTAKYDTSSDRWTARFMPPAHARLGRYQFSARLVDSEDGMGEWYEPEDVELEVLNNDPVAEISPVKTFTENKMGTFDGSGSTDVEDTGLTYSWDFGDGKKGKGIKPSHAYTTARTYTVTLTVTDSDGGTHEVETKVRVEEAPIFGGDDGDGSGLSSTFLLGGAVLLILILVIVLVILLMRRRATGHSVETEQKAGAGIPPEGYPDDHAGEWTSYEGPEGPLPPPPGPPGHESQGRPDAPSGPPEVPAYRVEAHRMYGDPEPGQRTYGEEERERQYE